MSTSAAVWATRWACLYNAYRAGTPLILTAGQQDRRLKFEEPILWSDMVPVAKPWTKWAVEVERAADLPLAIRRAVQTALMPPTGPVFLSIPIDVQREVGDFDLTVPKPLNPLVRPPLAELKRAAQILATAKNPAILAGSRVVEGDAIDELVKFAELVECARPCRIGYDARPARLSVHASALSARHAGLCAGDQSTTQRIRCDLRRRHGRAASLRLFRAGCMSSRHTSA